MDHLQVTPIPDALSSQDAAPLLCAGELYTCLLRLLFNAADSAAHKPTPLFWSEG